MESADSTQTTNPENDLWPFLRSRECAGCELYWTGIQAFPAPAAQREWISSFLLRLTAALKEQLQLRGEFFLQFRIATQVEKRLRVLARELTPQVGMARRPDAKLPVAPTTDQLRAAVAGAPFDVMDHIPDYCFWLHSPDPALPMKEFFGLGGTAMYYLKPDPESNPPAEIPYLKELGEAFPNLQLDRLKATMKFAYSQRDGFLGESKRLFGAGLESEPEYPGLSYIVPLLETKDFFVRPQAERESWFKLFDVFWRESTADNGLFLASKPPLESLLVRILKGMTADGLPYPIRR